MFFIASLPSFTRLFSGDVFDIDKTIHNRALKLLRVDLVEECAYCFDLGLLSHHKSN